jgi:NAD(P)-dependent dehydrogenase (short-subunit alcohol dehydrogenase family)
MSVIKPSTVILITGATSGIGHGLANSLLERGAAVIGVGRSRVGCEEVERAFQQRYPGAKVAYVLADLSLQSVVRKLSGEVSAVLSTWGYEGLNVLINNAATVPFRRTETAEGFEVQWAVNHLAPFLLTQELLPFLQHCREAKVVTVSSGSHYSGRMHWEDLQLERGYNPIKAYKQSKLANVLFTAELDRRLGHRSNIRAFAVEPGLVPTEIGQKTGFRPAGWYWKWWSRKGISVAESAAGIMNLMFNPDAQTSGEIYWKHGKPRSPNPLALDEKAGRKLWEISARMCALDPDIAGELSYTT